jgi:hypothetical protein
MSFYDPAIVEVLQGLRRDYDNERNPGLETIAPIVQHDALQGQFLVPDYSNLPEAGVNRAAGHYSSPEQAFQQYKDVTYALKRYMSREQIVPKRFGQVLKAQGIDMLQRANKLAMDEMHLIHAENVVVAAQGLNAGTAIDLSTASENLAAIITGDMDAMHADIGHAPDTVVMNRAVYSALRQQDEIFQGPALGEAGGRRLGAATADMVDAYFRAQFGLNILVTEYRTRGGASPYLLGNQMLFVKTGGLDGTMFTASNGPLMETLYREIGAGGPVGGGIVSDSSHAVVLVDAALGRKTAVTL